MSEKSIIFAQKMENNKKQIVRSFKDSLGYNYTMVLEFSVIVTNEYGPSWKVEVFIDNKKSQEFIFSGLVDINTIYTLFGCVNECEKNKNDYVISIPRGMKIKSMHYELQEDTLYTKIDNEEPKIEKQEQRERISESLLNASIESQDNSEDDGDPKDAFPKVVPQEPEQNEENESTPVNSELYTNEPISDGEITNALTINFGIHKPEDFVRYTDLIKNILLYSSSRKTNEIQRKTIKDLLYMPEGYSLRHKVDYVTRTLQWLVNNEFAECERLTSRDYLYTINESFYKIFTKN